MPGLTISGSVRIPPIPLPPRPRAGRTRHGLGLFPRSVSLIYCYNFLIRYILHRICIGFVPATFGLGHDLLEHLCVAVLLFHQSWLGQGFLG